MVDEHDGCSRCELAAKRDNLAHVARRVFLRPWRAARERVDHDEHRLDAGHDGQYLLLEASIPQVYGHRDDAERNVQRVDSMLVAEGAHPVLERAATLRCDVENRAMRHDRIAEEM